MKTELTSLLDIVDAALGPYDELLIGYSGGVDSTVLLHLLYQLRQYKRPKLQLQAVHVHHGLSCYADAWVKHCQQQCLAWQIPLQVSYVKLDSTDKNIESQARNARYQVFQNCLSASQTLVTAHHLNDQAEAFLLALKRGSGPKGLSSMSSQRQFYANQLVRPLLTVAKDRLLAYAMSQQLTWIEDESNASQQFERNFLRLTILPHLMQRWPHFNAMVARSAALCGEQERLLDHYLARDLASAVDPQGCFVIDVLMNAPEVKSFALLRRWLAEQKMLMPSREQLKVLLYEVALAREDANPSLQLTDSVVRRFQNKLYLLSAHQTVPESPIMWDLQQPLQLPADLGKLFVSKTGQPQIRAPFSHEQVTIRFFAHERVLLRGKRQSRPIKKIWQELAIAPWLRRSTPLLYYNDQLIAAIGYFVTAESTPLAEQPSLVIQHQLTKQRMVS